MSDWRSWINTVQCIDCLEGMKQMPDGCVGLVVTSPPYNVQVDYGEWYNDNVPFRVYIKKMLNVFYLCSKKLTPGGHLVINIGNTGRQPYISLSSYFSIALSKRLVMRGEIIWDKGNITETGTTAWGSWLSPNSPSLRDMHEYLLVFRKNGTREGKSDLTRDEFIEYTKSIWKIMPETNRKYHPAPYPPELVGRVVKLYSFIGELVLDPFAGVGTTNMTCKQLGRRFIGFEINPKYVEICNQRLAQEVLDFNPARGDTEER